LNTVLWIIHLFVTLLLIGVVLIQRSEGGGLGIGSSQGMGSFMSGRGTANLLTRTTAILAIIFMALSMALAALNKGGNVNRSILDTTPISAPAPASAPALPASGAAPAGVAPGPVSGGGAPQTPAPAAPSGPSAPTN
jgi:preprotein translocase subunit SecG